MGSGFKNRPGKTRLVQSCGSTTTLAVGKRTFIAQIAQESRHGPNASDAVQRKAVDPAYDDLVAAVATPVQRSASAPTEHVDGSDGRAVQQAAARGIAGRGSPLLHADTIQHLFGRHDVSGVQAHLGGVAETASRAIGAEAHTTGNHVAFAAAPSLRTAAHEAAHIVQQRGSVQLTGGVGEAGDEYEQHADQVADALVQGKSAEQLLDRYAASSDQCPAWGSIADGNEACTSCGADAPETGSASAPHAIQRSPLPEPGPTDGAAALQLPRSLHQTLAPNALSDDEIAAEIGAIRAWLDAQSASSKESESLALALGQLAHELVTRHPGPSLPATAPRPANSITPADVRRASAEAIGGVTAAGAVMAVPGLSPMPPPVTMPPPMLEPSLTPPVAAPPPPLPAPTPPVAPAPRPVPVAPIAAGVLAFLIVLLWPNDSIESGAEERRKLDEYDRRRRQQTPDRSPVEATGPTPEPAPSPVPRPVPPVGTAPHERRLPNQTCENQVLDALQKAMHDVCDRIPR